MSSYGFWIKKVFKNFVISVPVTIAFLDSVGYVAKVEGVSMQPALNPDEQKSHDYVLLNKWSVRNYVINQGEIVALKCPRNPDLKLIKRVIAKEGETIKAANKLRYVLIPTGHCWVEGDNVSHSMDSNFFGPVPMGLIIAKASHIVWPPSRWQRLEARLPPGRNPTKWPNAAAWTDEATEIS